MIRVIFAFFLAFISIPVIPIIRTAAEFSEDKFVGAVARDDVKFLAGYLEKYGREILSKPSERDADWEGNYPAHLAAKFNSTAALKLFMKEGADANAVNNLGRTALHVAAAATAPAVKETEKSADFIRKKVKNLARKMRFKKKGNEDGDVGIIEILARNGADLEARERNGGCTPLHLACYANNVAAVKSLASLGADLNARRGGSVGTTPLIAAVQRKFLPVVEILTEAGADVAFPDLLRNTPLYFAVKLESLRMVEILSAAADKYSFAKRNNALRRPLDVLFEFSSPNRAIMIRMLKSYPYLNKDYALTALKVFNDALLSINPVWKSLRNYVEICLNELRALSERKPDKKRDDNSAKHSTSNPFLSCVRPRPPPKESETLSDLEKEVIFYVKENVLELLTILQAQYDACNKDNGSESEATTFRRILRAERSKFKTGIAAVLIRGTKLNLWRRVDSRSMWDLLQDTPLGDKVVRLATIMALIKMMRKCDYDSLIQLAPRFLLEDCSKDYEI